MSLIQADNICVIRDETHILQDVSVGVGEHDFITIVGPNGAGKSTLLHCLMGLIEPDSGTVKRQPNLRIGYVPQRLEADPVMPMSVKAFLRLCHGASPAALGKVAKETDIGSCLRKPFYALSSGELQRVLLARALLRKPQLLVLDEPAQNLDIAGQLAFYKLIEKIYKERKVSIVMVSHDLHMVMASSNQVMCLYHHVCCSGEPKEVAKDPEFTKLFGKDMAAMMAVYHHAHDHDHAHGHVHGEDCNHD